MRSIYLSLWTLSVILMAAALSTTPSPVPRLNGAHFRITVLQSQDGFVDATESDDGGFSYSGYCIDILNSISKPDRANFTFELLRPSGYGSMCSPRANIKTDPPFAAIYSSQANCAQSDVTDLPKTNYTTDFYMGMFYITPKRQLTSRFTMPFSPPVSGANQMFGTATGLRSIEELVEQQNNDQRGPACVVRGSANADFLNKTFPSIQLTEIGGTHQDMVDALQEGLCDVIISDSPIGSQFVLQRSRLGQCKINGKPIGMVGRPLSYGPSHYGMGIRKDIPMEVVDTINYWLNVLMTCKPNGNDEVCRGDSLSELYERAGGTGEECGYVNFPAEGKRLLDPWALAAVTVGSLIFVILNFTVLYLYKLKQQRHRIKKRFVQQIARNIAIGPSPGSIPAQKLAEQVQHIGDESGAITKEALLKWISDVKLEFISKSDFEALWAAMDVDGVGKIDAVEFFVFLSSCGPQFEEVYEEEQRMPKMERLKLAARRLENINAFGEAGVRKIEHQLERRSRLNAHTKNPKRNSDLTSTTIERGSSLYGSTFFGSGIFNSTFFRR